MQFITMSFPSSSQHAQPSLSFKEAHQPCRRFTFSEIHEATRGFAESLVIGCGGFGKVYQGTISYGSSRVEAAIKVPLKEVPELTTSKDEFLNEVEMVSVLRHCHLVSLIGYCNERRKTILVYEFMPNGTLEDRLHKCPTTLTWVSRLKICLGVARGLNYLHDSRVIHRDVKSSNILLDSSWAAKISDFGLSRKFPEDQQSNVIYTGLKGSYGYLDPYNVNSCTVSRTSDVYAFGVVLFEVLCGKQANIEPLGLAAWAQDLVKEGRVKQIVDLNLKGCTSFKCLKKLAQLAVRCVHIPQLRPTMAQVVTDLESILASQEKANQMLLTYDMKIFSKMVPTFLIPSYRESSVVRRKLELLDIYTVQDGNQMLRLFGFDDIKVATDNFSVANRTEGFGDHGYLYKGKLKNGPDIAICGPSSDHSREVSILLQVKHENLIQLFGYCIEGTGIYLIYDFAPYTTLSSLLSDTNCPRLGWDERYKILLGVARALVYLQQHAPSRIIHHAVRTSNILLDEQMNPKLSNFKFAVCYTKTETSGYKPPEYIMQGRPSTETDVSDFGEVVLETLCGHRVNIHRTSMGSQDFVWNNWKKGTYSNILDPRINTNVDSKVIKGVLQIGLLCIQGLITMEEVVDKLIGTSSTVLRVPAQPLINFDDDEDIYSDDDEDI